MLLCEFAFVFYGFFFIMVFCFLSIFLLIWFLCFVGTANVRCLITRMTSWCSVKGARIGKISVFCFTLLFYFYYVFVSGFFSYFRSLILALDVLFCLDEGIFFDIYSSPAPAASLKVVAT